MDDGAVAYVDIAQLSPSVAQILRQGTVVSVYGQSLNDSGPSPCGGDGPDVRVDRADPAHVALPALTDAGGPTTIWSLVDSRLRASTVRTFRHS
jgi:hypothetical protein